METQRLEFQKNNEGSFNIFNQNNECIGLIRKERVGRFMHWCHIIRPQDVGLGYLLLSPGCQDEIRSFEKMVNAQERKVSPETPSKERNLGTVQISSKVLYDDFVEILKLLDAEIVMKRPSMSVEGATNFLLKSSHFKKLNEGDLIPGYCPILERHFYDGGRVKGEVILKGVEEVGRHD